MAALQSRGYDEGKEVPPCLLRGSGQNGRIEEYNHKATMTRFRGEIKSYEEALASGYRRRMPAQELQSRGEAEGLSKAAAEDPGRTSVRPGTDPSVAVCRTRVLRQYHHAWCVTSTMWPR